MTDILFGFFQSNLSGFYDPCPEEEKMLRIRYLFREAVHEVTVGDTEPVRIPKQCKRCCFVLLYGGPFYSEICSKAYTDTSRRW